MTTPCQLCGNPIQYDPIEGFPAIVPRVCAKCGRSSLVKESEALSMAQAQARADLWSATCPSAYQLISEGGITDLARLVSECPIDWPDATREKPGLLIAGPSRKGKTRWAWRCLRQDFDAGKSILAFTPRSFEAAYRDSEGQHKLKAFLDDCSTVGVFFLDDLGKAAWSQNTLETFYEIVDQRAANLRPIYVTTNFTRTDLAVQLRMDSAMMEPLMRRLAENCRCVSV